MPVERRPRATPRRPRRPEQGGTRRHRCVSLAATVNGRHREMPSVLVEMCAVARVEASGTATRPGSSGTDAGEGGSSSNGTVADASTVDAGTATTNTGGAPSSAAGGVPASSAAAGGIGRRRRGLLGRTSPIHRTSVYLSPPARAASGESPFHVTSGDLIDLEGDVIVLPGDSATLGLTSTKVLISSPSGVTSSKPCPSPPVNR